MHPDYSYVIGKEKESKREDYEELLKIREELKKYNMFEFIKNVSALMLFPKNQSKSVIFQSMISVALSISRDEMNENNIMSIGKFNKIVNRFSNLNRIVYVDPPEFPFVLPVMFYNNYHLFMGASALSVSNLNMMLKVLKICKNEMGEFNYNKLTKDIIAFLQLSEQVYIKTNINMDTLKSYNKDEDIFVPDSNVLNKYNKYIEFPREYIEKLFGENINNYVCNFGEINVDIIDQFEYQVFYDKPIIITDKTYIIVDVTTFLHLLMKKIIMFMKVNCDVNIVMKYNICIKEELRKSFLQLGNLVIDSKQFNINLIDNEVYSEMLLSSGNDGIIIDIILFDNGSNYETKRNFIIPLGREYISKRINFIKQKLLRKNVDDYKITVVVTPTSIGRNIYFSLYNCNNHELLLLSNYEIEAIAINESKEEMFLQRYLIARKRLKYYKKNDFSELNTIAFYVNRNYSFYIDDRIDSKEAIIGLIGEYSADYILQAYQKEQKHLCKGIQKNTMIEVIKIDGNIFFAPRSFSA